MLPNLPRSDGMPVPPTKLQLRAAAGGSIPDVLATGLQVLFCGINPGLYSAAAGHHFARPGNRFWPALHQAGFTPRELAPWEDRQLLGLGLGVTNLVHRATATAAELDRAELRAGLRELEVKVAGLAPAWLAVLGVGAYRTAFAHTRAAVGPQPAGLAGARVWVLPNPSGLNAHYQLDALATAYSELRRNAC